MVDKQVYQAEWICEGRRYNWPAEYGSRNQFGHGSDRYVWLGLLICLLAPADECHIEKYLPDAVARHWIDNSPPKHKMNLQIRHKSVHGQIWMYPPSE
jgi:hypothetical protein